MFKEGKEGINKKRSSGGTKEVTKEKKKKYISAYSPNANRLLNPRLLQQTNKIRDHIAHVSGGLDVVWMCRRAEPTEVGDEEAVVILQKEEGE